jgi:hypothetical protein
MFCIVMVHLATTTPHETRTASSEIRDRVRVPPITATWNTFENFCATMRSCSLSFNVPWTFVRSNKRGGDKDGIYSSTRCHEPATVSALTNFTRECW